MNSLFVFFFSPGTAWRRNVSYKLMYSNTRPPITDTVWESHGNFRILAKEVCHWGQALKIHSPIHSCLSPCTCHIAVSKSFLIFLPPELCWSRTPAAVPPLPSWILFLENSKTELTPFSSRALLEMTLYHSNRKVINAFGKLFALARHWHSYTVLYFMFLMATLPSSACSRGSWMSDSEAAEGLWLEHHPSVAWRLPGLWPADAHRWTN